MRPWNLAVFRRNEYYDLAIRDPSWGLHGLGREQVLGPLSNAFATTQPPERRALTGLLLLMIGDAIRAQGNGGTLLVLPANEAHNRTALEWLDLGSNRPSVTLEAEFDKYVPILKASAGDPLETIQKTSLGEYLRGRPDLTDPDVLNATAVLGRLSAIDGAVVVTEELELVAFGATIRPPGKGPTIEKIYRRSYLDYADPMKPGAEIEIGKLGGTRRQSAARFVANVYDTIAITVSHDGPTTLAMWFAKDEETGAPRPHLMTHFETILD